jgi:DNA-directed RNA polymerase specialized sigma24 family protein
VNAHLEILARHDEDWKRIVRSFGHSEHYDDIVQDFYMKVYNNKVVKVIENNQPNKVYCWVILRNLYFDYHRLNKEHINIDIIRDLVQEEHMELKRKWEKVYNTEEETKKDFHWFDLMLWQLYTTTDLSMRDIARDTNISLKTIFATLKHCREQIQNKLWQEEDQKDLEIVSKSLQKQQELNPL